MTIGWLGQPWACRRGNLILESSNGITTAYVLDERGALPTLLGEVRSDGTTRLYAYGPEGFAAQMTVGGSGIEYPLTDGLGSVRQLTDSSGNVILSRSYDAFGNLRYSSGTGVTHLGYTGELQDLTTGLVYLRARFYHPVLGRFLQRDSFAGFGARPQSLNRYSYTENNPVNYTDPSGHYVDTLFDIGSIGYDLYRIVQDNILHDCDNLSENIFSLVLDVGGAALPFATGLGVMYRAGKMARFARWWDDFQILRQTGIWGGTIRDMARGLEANELLFLRPRPVPSGIWELVWKQLGRPIPKPSLSYADELAKLRWGFFDTGLRKMQAIKDIPDFAIEKGRRFMAHSDNDLQAIMRDGAIMIRGNAQEVVDRVNEVAGHRLLQHADLLTGLAGRVNGAKSVDLHRATLVLDHLGNVQSYSSAWSAFYRHTTSDVFHQIANLVTDFDFPR